MCSRSIRFRRRTAAETATPATTTAPSASCSTSGAVAPGACPGAHRADVQTRAGAEGTETAATRVAVASCGAAEDKLAAAHISAAATAIRTNPLRKTLTNFHHSDGPGLLAGHPVAASSTADPAFRDSSAPLRRVERRGPSPQGVHSPLTTRAYRRLPICPEASGGCDGVHRAIPPHQCRRNRTECRSKGKSQTLLATLPSRQAPSRADSAAGIHKRGRAKVPRAFRDLLM